MARHALRGRLLILILIVTALLPWPSGQLQAQARRPDAPVTGLVVPEVFTAAGMAGTSLNSDRGDRVALPAAATNPPEIATLAAGLENDPLAIYDYVRNQIDVIPTWGLLKSPRETLLSGEGNPFDQAALLAALLNAAGYTTQYVRSEIRMTNAQAMNWTGAADANAAVDILLAGGIQVTLDTGRIRIPHVWVRVSAGGTHDLDPSFKTYTERAGQDLHPLMGFDPATFISRAELDADITDRSVQHLNIPNIETDLTSYATNLLGYLRANNPFASVEDLIGERQIVPIHSTNYPTPAYDIITAATAANLSNATYSLNIQLSNINYTTTTESVDGERITIFYECATQLDCQAIQAAGGIDNLAPGAVNMIPRLRVGGQLVGSGGAVPLGSDQQLVITITTPDQQAIPFQRILFVGGWYALPMRLQSVSNRSMARQIAMLEAAVGQGLALDDERVLGQMLHVMGLAYYNEVGLGDRIDSRLAKVARLPYFSVMVASRDILVSANTIDPGAYTVDVGLRIDNVVALASGPNAQSRERAWSFSAGVRSSAAEHAILEQFQPIPAISTVQILKRAAATGDTIYYITPTNQSTILPLLDPDVRNIVAPRIRADQYIVVPRNPVTYDQWYGTGWIELNPATGEAGYIIAGGLGAAQGAKPLTIRGGGYTQAVPAIGIREVLKRLFAMVKQFAVGMRSLSCSPCSFVGIMLGWQRSRQAANKPMGSALEASVNRENAGMSEAARGKRPQVGDPINAISGAFQYPHRDLAQLGGRGFPLEFERFYTSDRHNLAGPLGFGWTHSYNTSFAIGTEWERGFGGRTALEAAPALAAAQIGVDLFTIANIPQQRFAMDTIVGQWLMARITGNAVVLTDPAGAAATHVRLIDGTYLAPALAANLNTVSIDGAGNATLVWEDGGTMLFDSDGRPTALDDANGNRTALSYNDRGLLGQVRDAAGRTLTFSYDGQDHLSQIVDPAGRAYRYSYDGQGNLQTSTDARGGVTTYAYDSAHRLTRITDPLGATYVDNQYDALGRVSLQTDGRSGQTRLLYGGDHTLAIDPLGSRSLTFYDARDRLLAAQNALGIRQSIGYDAGDHMIRLTDGLGQPLTFAYDARGHLTTMTDALNNTTVWAYDAVGNPASFTDQRGKLWQFAYDAAHNLVSATDPLGNATQYTYEQGQLKTLQRGNITNVLAYDAHGNLVSVKNALGYASEWSYDEIGRPIQFTDGTGAIARFSYDANDNLVKIVDPAGGATNYANDGNDSLSSMTDANGHMTSYAYDSQFNLVSVTDALGGITRYTYDAADRLIRLTDANGHATNYQHDQAGRVVTITDPLNRSITFAYDNGDRLIALTRADSSTIAYTYDALGRLTGIDNPSGADSSFSYDAAGRMLAAAYGATWSANYQYDDAGRLTGVSEPGRQLVVGYTYNQTGRRTGLRVDQGGALRYNLTYSYDTADRLTSMADAMADPAQTINFQYDAADRLAEILEPNGARALYTYTAGRLTQVKQLPRQGAAIAAYDYTYDAAGNITRVSDTTPAGSFSTSYGYDALDRLVLETYPRYAIQYAYDAVGNMTRRVDSLAALDYSYDSADQLLARGSESFSYDPNGNMTAWQNPRGTSTYSYDYQNRLSSLTRTDGANMTFSYDAFGRRLTTEGPSGTRSFLYDGFEAILEGGSDLGQATARYLYGDGMLIARSTERLGLTTYHGDARENVRYLFSDLGQPLDGYDYDGFGRTGAPAGIDANPFRFVGQRSVYQHDMIGWPDLYMGHRYYDPDGGRFRTLDPLQGDLLRPASQNPYVYGLDNALSNSDPLGLRYRTIMSRAIMGDRSLGLPSRGPLDGQGAMAPYLGRLPSFAQILSLLPRTLQYLRTLGLDSLRMLRKIVPDGRDGKQSRGETPPAEAPPPPQEPRGPFMPYDQEAPPDWQLLTKPGSVYALACTPNDRLFGGSFHAGLLWSTTPGHGSWANASPAGVGELATGNGVVYAGARHDGVLASSDGSSWTPANSGLAANDVYALAIEPGAPDRLFAGTEMGLFMRDGAGATWTRPAAAVPGRVVSELAFAGTTLLAITDMGLYRSTTGGPWQRPSHDLPAVQIYTLLAGGSPGTIYAGTALGGYVSTDSGDTWAPLGTGLAGRPVHALAIDPLNAQHMVAGTTAGLFTSADGGATWNADSRTGLERIASQIGALAFCREGGDINLYVGTGAGVYATTGLRLRTDLPIIMR